MKEWDDIVKQYKNQIALQCNGTVYTYEQVDQITDCIAENLIDRGIKKESYIGIYMDKSEQFILVMLGILKADCVFVPLSKKYPTNRIKSICDCVKSNYIICMDLMDLGESIHQIFYKDLLNEHCATQVTRCKERLTEEAYVLFTSGSTGVPKGISIRYDSLMNLVNGIDSWFDWEKNTSQHVIAVFAPYIFDVSMGQIFYALFSGNTLDIITDGVKENIPQLVNHIIESKIEVMDITPTFLKILMDYIKIDDNKAVFVNYMILAGEALPLQLAKDYINMYPKEMCPVIIDAYGPTETCVYATSFRVDVTNINQLDRMYIGKPLFNVRTYVLNSELKESFIGEEGEIYIAGKGVACGYVNEGKLTEKSFMKDTITGQGMMYKTGDLGILHMDGNIEYLGRIDHQVKIRGLRIELEEIEIRLLQIDGIRQCKVKAVKHDNDTILMAYIILDYDISLHMIRSHLKMYLPDYMIPDYYFRMDRFPIGATGKLDEKLLPTKIQEALKEEHETNLPKVHRFLCEEENQFLALCKAVLDKEELSIDDNFLIQGGNSLSLYKLSFQIWKIWRVSIQISNLYACETLYDIFQLVKQSQGQVRKLSEENDPPASMALTQIQYYIIRQKTTLERTCERPESSIPLFDLGYRIKIDRHLEANRLKEAVAQVIARNELLRSKIQKQGRKYLWVTQDTGINPFMYVPCKEVTSRQIDGMMKEFSIDTLPLFQFILFENCSGEQEIVLHFHHTIFDYSSLRIFLDQLLVAYEGKKLEPLTMDFVEYNSRPRMNQESIRDFWKTYFAKRPIAIPFQKNAMQTGKKGKDHYESMSFSFDLEKRKYIQILSKKYRTTEYNILYLGLALLLYQYSRQSDFVIGSLFHGRYGGLDAEIIGMFTTTLGVRFRINKHETIENFIRRGIESIQQVYRNQYISLYEIYTLMPLDEMAKGNLFDVLLNYVDLRQEQLEQSHCRVWVTELDLEPTYTNFQVLALPEDHQLKFVVYYNETMYEKEFVEQLMKQYSNVFEYLTNEEEIID